MTPLRRLWIESAGASAVEFALVVGPLLLMLFGAIEAGRLFWTQHALTEVSVSAARCMGVRQIECTTESGAFDVAATRAYVIARGRAFALDLDADDLALTPDTQCGGVPGFSRIEIAYHFSSPLPDEMLRALNSLTLAADACFPNQAG